MTFTEHYEKYYDKDKNKGYQHKHRRTWKGTTSHKLHTARKRAKEAGFECDMSLEDIRKMWHSQEGLCALSRTPLGLIPSIKTFFVVSVILAFTKER